MGNIQLILSTNKLNNIMVLKEIGQVIARMERENPSTSTNIPPTNNSCTILGYLFIMETSATKRRGKIKPKLSHKEQK